MDTTPQRTRLEPMVEEESRWAPWIKAPMVEDCHVFWLPVSGFPIRSAERAWFLAFLGRFSALLQEKDGLREEVFLQFAVASGIYAERFQQYAMKVQVLPGLSRRPEEPLQGKPDLQQAKEEVERNKGFDMEKWTSDYTFWFQYKRAEEQREMFWGAGGMTLLFLKPDPKTVPPVLPFTPRFRAAMPVFQHVDVDAMMGGAMALNDGFLTHSKAVFGKGLERGPGLGSTAFVVPLLESKHLVQATPESRASWFEVFDVYCRESTEDKGVLLAFQKDYRPWVLQVLASLAEEKLEYPIRISHAQD